jgi:integrase
VKPAAKALGIGPISWHSLRYTYTTLGRRAGVNAETMRDLLGHSSVTTTLDRYSQACDRPGAAEVIEHFVMGEKKRETELEPQRNPCEGTSTSQAVEINGGRDRTRTCDLLRVKQAL